MKYLLMLVCVCLAIGCSSETSNIVGDADAEALAEYEAALAEADKMAAGDSDYEK
ncbi:hypothetical protein [Roseiconus lacunae]|uniref:Secreted protein n=1 Tax=Roseiconus lacunae TaxID=2605694 RepID=A0ABT7PL63_9BACT|nr:hypothetical protein [Roseiconus lacunae]MCD0461483.1 hypothetical protein [Roseiconus lacunae]MDM4017249.1 hypothetical protein [Roseiconus lacunae]WRQ51174.1 hypothetical protein U8335_01250 [Stieleria sp. HD01]